MGLVGQLYYGAISIFYLQLVYAGHYWKIAFGREATLSVVSESIGQCLFHRLKSLKKELCDKMDRKNLETTMYYAVEDLKFFVEYRNSLTPEELVVSTIDFEGMGIF